jgi:hypothetical protein
MGKNRGYNSGQKCLGHQEVKRWQPYDGSWYVQSIWKVRYRVDTSTGDVLEALVAPGELTDKEAQCNHGHYWYSKKDQCWKFKANKLKSKDQRIKNRVLDLKDDASYAGYIARTAKNANY